MNVAPLLIIEYFVSTAFILTNLLLLSSPGADPEDVILSAFKVLDPEGTGSIKKELWALFFFFLNYLICLFVFVVGLFGLFFLKLRGIKFIDCVYLFITLV